MSVRWLIAGCGYVGTALLRHELEAGYGVVAVSRNPESSADFENVSNVNWLSLDLAEHDSLPDPLQQAPWVSVFLVSPGLREQNQEQSYLRALRNWHQWCSQLGISLRMMASSSGIYEQTSGEWVDESTELKIVSDRALALQRAEACFWESISVDSVGVVLRIGGIYGPGRHRFLQSVRFSDDSDAWLNLIYLDDLVSALQACAHVMRERGKEVEGTYNLSDGHPVLRSDLSRWLETQNTVPTADSAVRRAPRGNANRRISANLFQNTFQWSPAYADYRMGYQRILTLMQNDCGKS
jgi:nucleoside-diphosphate-sugar epimerase